MLLPGLHFLGPDDPRFRRFAAVLAQTGAEVVAPHLTEVERLKLSPRMFDEARAALELAAERAGGPVGVMSISFGSIAALHLAANCPDLVRQVVIFGGYRRLETVFTFALGAAAEGFDAALRDPLNGPAVLGNLVEELLPEGEREAFLDATVKFARATWSRAGAGPEWANKLDGRHLRVGAEIEGTLSGAARALFRVGCRLEGDPLALALSAIPAARERIAFLDPGPLLSRVRAPVTCVHGRDDDVIPWSESVALAHDLPDARALITGLYGHTGRAGGGAGGVRALWDEVRTMAEVLGTLGQLCDH